MTLVITFLAAAIVTAIWYAKAPNSDMRLGTLALMYWGAALMWCVDGINGLIEGEGFIEIADTAAMLNSVSSRLLCVRGNCDADVDQMMLDFPILAGYALICDGGYSFTAVHWYRTDGAPGIPRSGTVVSGHTHVPEDRTADGLRLVNPGSVSIPKGGSRHSYAVFSGGTFIFKDVLTGEEYALS